MTHLVGELARDDSVPDQQEDGVVGDDCHQQQEQHPREEPREADGCRDACRQRTGDSS